MCDTFDDLPVICPQWKVVRLGLVLKREAKLANSGLVFVCKLVSFCVRCKSGFGAMTCPNCEAVRDPDVSRCKTLVRIMRFGFNLKVKTFGDLKTPQRKPVENRGLGMLTHPKVKLLVIGNTEKIMVFGRLACPMCAIFENMVVFERLCRRSA